MANWMEEQRLKGLSCHAKRPVSELRKVVVTDRMLEAATDYLCHLYDDDWNNIVLEDIFRIMAVLQPRVVDQEAKALMP